MNVNYLHFFPWSLPHPASRLAQHSIVCCAREHLLLRNKIGTPPNLRISKSPSNESKKLCELRERGCLCTPTGFGFAESTLRFASLIFGASCVSLNRCQVRRPQGDRPTNIILPLSKLQLNPNPVNLVNPVKKRFIAVLHLSTSTRLKTITIRPSTLPLQLETPTPAHPFTTFNISSNRT